MLYGSGGWIRVPDVRLESEGSASESSTNRKVKIKWHFDNILFSEVVACCVMLKRCKR
jgi:hypothetical protein